MSTMEHVNTSWHTYPSIFALGHKAIQDLLLDDVLVEEKIDGSQFSFGMFDVGAHGSGDEIDYDQVLRCKSKSQEINIIEPEKMFAKAVEWCVANKNTFHPGWTYRCEFLGKPKHNTLAYDHAPINNLIVFDINDGEESYLNHVEKSIESARLGLECVPQLERGRITQVETIKLLLDHTSCLGGTNIEGVVVKNYTRFGLDKKVLMGKYVSEAFKEVHGNEWKKANPTSSDIIAQIGARYSTSARWQKAVQHLRDASQLTDSPQDIGFLIKEVPIDVWKECESEIEQALVDWAWPKIRREITRGLPQWYKEQLLEKQFVVEETKGINDDDAKVEP